MRSMRTTLGKEVRARRSLPDGIGRQPLTRRQLQRGIFMGLFAFFRILRRKNSRPLALQLVTPFRELPE